MIADALLEQVADRSNEIESLGHIPEDLVTQLRLTNCFSMLLPESLGGPQLAYPNFIRFIQALAEQDGSVGWCANQGSVLASLATQLPQASARNIWTSPDRSIANGPPAGPCRAEKCDGGFRLTGRWSFSSGCQHSDYLVGVARVEGLQEVRMCFFHREQAELDRTWTVNGLKGTGSWSFSVTDLFVPDAFTLCYETAGQGPSLYRIPLNLLFAGGFAAVALGVSRAALDFAIQRCQEKTKRFDQQVLAANAQVQAELGEAEANWRAINSYLHESANQVWEALEAGAPMSDDLSITLRAAATHTIRQSGKITDIAYNLCSTDSIFTQNDIQRRFQDMHVITQHLQGRPEVYSLVGQYLLGVPFERTLL